MVRCKGITTFVVRDNLRDLWHIGRTRQEIFPVQ